MSVSQILILAVVAVLVNQLKKGRSLVLLAVSALVIYWIIFGWLWHQVGRVALTRLDHSLSIFIHFVSRETMMSSRPTHFSI